MPPQFPQPDTGFAFGYVLHFPLNPHRYLVPRDDDPLLPRPIIPSSHCRIPIADVAVSIEIMKGLLLSAVVVSDFPHPSTKRIDIKKEGELSSLRSKKVLQLMEAENWEKSFE